MTERRAMNEQARSAYEALRQLWADRERAELRQLWADRERTELRHALGQIHQPCPYCLGAVGVVKWSKTRGRWVITIVHARDCAVPGSRLLRDDVESYTRACLRLYGARVGDQYNEDDFIAGHVRAARR